MRIVARPKVRTPLEKYAALLEGGDFFANPTVPVESVTVFTEESLGDKCVTGETPYQSYNESTISKKSLSNIFTEAPGDDDDPDAVRDEMDTDVPEDTGDDMDPEIPASSDDDMSPEIPADEPTETSDNNPPETTADDAEPNAPEENPADTTDSPDTDSEPTDNDQTPEAEPTSEDDSVDEPPMDDDMSDMDPDASRDTSSDPDISGDTDTVASDSSTESDQTQEGQKSEVEAMRRYNLYKNFLNLHYSMENYCSTIDSMIYDDVSQNILAKKVSAKLKQLDEILYDYMLFKYESNSYIQSLFFYKQVNAAIYMCFNLLTNKNK